MPHSKELEQDEVQTICRTQDVTILQNKQSGTFGEHTIHDFAI
ncbi:protein of unknown function [Nitrosotalea devaniterrae]|uniref:Uncharacterized protein n=1 Tax=Nitrosotalea devaniterrae TaxID=1078905 RepID=A0A128A408_9ARCH|nr:protein of unknown function [Candidatus Nitrosotalea devanaterra]